MGSKQTRSTVDLQDPEIEEIEGHRIEAFFPSQDVIEALRLKFLKASPSVVSTLPSSRSPAVEKVRLEGSTAIVENSDVPKQSDAPVKEQTKPARKEEVPCLPVEKTVVPPLRQAVKKMAPIRHTMRNGVSRKGILGAIRILANAWRGQAVQPVERQRFSNVITSDCAPKRAPTIDKPKLRPPSIKTTSKPKSFSSLLCKEKCVATTLIQPTKNLIQGRREKSVERTIVLDKQATSTPSHQFTTGTTSGKPGDTKFKAKPVARLVATSARQQHSKRTDRDEKGAKQRATKRLKAEGGSNVRVREQTSAGGSLISEKLGVYMKGEKDFLKSTPHHPAATADNEPSRMALFGSTSGIALSSGNLGYPSASTGQVYMMGAQRDWSSNAGGGGPPHSQWMSGRGGNSRIQDGDSQLKRLEQNPGISPVFPPDMARPPFGMAPIHQSEFGHFPGGMHRMMPPLELQPAPLFVDENGVIVGQASFPLPMGHMGQMPSGHLNARFGGEYMSALPPQVGHLPQNLPNEGSRFDSRQLPNPGSLPPNFLGGQMGQLQHQTAMGGVPQDMFLSAPPQHMDGGAPYHVFYK
mmetsp:Transcript_43401/g.112905  ORF Transcript_43401/g.112905 Transcript_43401/m.112905 type:complete len:580 (-) Transcript_43401:1240-2979(-)